MAARGQRKQIEKQYRERKLPRVEVVSSPSRNLSPEEARERVLSVLGRLVEGER